MASALVPAIGLLLLGSCKTPATVVRKTPQTDSINLVKKDSFGIVKKPSVSLLKKRAAVVDPVGPLQVFTIAGTGLAANTTGPGPQSALNAPAGIATGANGNVYIADAANHRICLFNSIGLLYTIAGTGAPGYAEGTGTSAAFNSPTGVAVDGAGNIYVADQNNNRIRKITPAGEVSTFAGTGEAGFSEGPGATAKFNAPSAIAVDAAGNVYVADAGNQRIRKITPDGLVRTLAGNGNPGYGEGPPSFAQFNNPVGIALDADGMIYVADANNYRIRKITPSGVTSTLAGNGTPGNLDGEPGIATFNLPFGVAVDIDGTVYVADKGNHRIRQITPGGVVSPFAGSATPGYVEGALSAAKFALPAGVAVDSIGNVLVADQANNRIREIGYSVIVSTLVGTGTAGDGVGTGTGAQLKDPMGFAINSSGTTGYIANHGNHQIRSINMSTGGVMVLDGLGQGFTDGPRQVARLNGPFGMAVDAAGFIYVADMLNNRIRKIQLREPPYFGWVTTLAGNGTYGYADGPGNTAAFYYPAGVAVDAAGFVYVTDEQNNRIRKITPDGVVSTLAGNGTAGFAEGQGDAAEFNSPNGIAVDAAGNLYVADHYNNRIRKITPGGLVSTLAGSGNQGFNLGQGAAADFNSPTGVAVDPSGNVYVADTNNGRICKITPGGWVTTLAGNGYAGYVDGPGRYAWFKFPTAVTLDPAGNVYVTEFSNNVIRKIKVQ